MACRQQADAASETTSAPQPPPQPLPHIIATTPSQCSRRCATGPDHCNTTQRVNARRVTRRHARAHELRLHHQQAKDVTIHCVHPRITTYKVHTASQSRVWAPQSGHRILGTAIWPPQSGQNDSSALSVLLHHLVLLHFPRTGTHPTQASGRARRASPRPGVVALILVRRGCSKL